MEYSKNLKNEYEETSKVVDENKSIFEFYFKKFIEDYHNFLARYFVSEGGVVNEY